MLQKDIPVYRDPDSFETEGLEIKYPCSTNLMIYKALTHRYYITAEGFQQYGVDLENYMSSSPNKEIQFAEEVTDDIYGVMARIAPYNYQYNCYLVAQSISLQFRDRYTCRKQFEKALIYQAQYKLINIDVRDINGIDLETGNSIYHKQLRRELRHISPKALDILQSLGLFYNGALPGKNLIDYDKVM